MITVLTIKYSKDRETMMYTCTITLKLNDHNVYVRVDHRGHIHCFKYNNRTCDFAVFSDQFEASEFILESLPTVYYKVTVNDE